MRVSGIRLTVAEIFTAAEAKIDQGEDFSSGEVAELLSIAKWIDGDTEKRVNKVRFKMLLDMSAQLCGSKNEAAARIAEAFDLQPEALRRSMQPSRGIDKKGHFRLYTEGRNP